MVTNPVSTGFILFVPFFKRFSERLWSLTVPDLTYLSSYQRLLLSELKSLDPFSLINFDEKKVTCKAIKEYYFQEAMTFVTNPIGGRTAFTLSVQGEIFSNNNKLFEMSDHVQIDGSTRIGTIGGTLLVTILNIFHNDLVRTIGFAAIGASVSFFVSLFSKWMMGKIEKRKGIPKYQNLLIKL